MIENSKIDEIVNKIALKFDPDKIILFGSYASGDPGHDSDQDLFIIQELDQPRHYRGIEIRKSLIGVGVPMDIIVYTPSEFESEKNTKFSLIHNALKTSKVLYEQ